jgi:hypothetical protein
MAICSTLQLISFYESVRNSTMGGITEMPRFGPAAYEEFAYPPDRPAG